MSDKSDNWASEYPQELNPPAEVLTIINSTQSGYFVTNTI